MHQPKNHVRNMAKMGLIASALVFVTQTAVCQEPVTISGKSSYILSDTDNITLREAKIKCVEMARAEALKNEFGTVVSSDFINSDRVVNDEFSSIIVSDISTSVKGEWLGDEREPEITVEYVNGDLIFTAEVWGKAREIQRAAIDIKWQLQKDINGQRIESDTFSAGERFYVTFQSPANGYVAIYLITGDNETACLLPYRKDASGRFAVKGGKDYTFFDKSTDPTAPFYKFNTQWPQELNQLVIIYSPNAFTKCTDIGRDPRHPNALDSKDFAKWLLKSQRADKDMTVHRKWVTITGQTD